MAILLKRLPVVAETFPAAEATPSIDLHTLPGVSKKIVSMIDQALKAFPESDDLIGLKATFEKLSSGERLSSDDFPKAQGFASIVTCLKQLPTRTPVSFRGIQKLFQVTVSCLCKFRYPSENSPATQMANFLDDASSEVVEDVKVMLQRLDFALTGASVAEQALQKLQAAAPVNENAAIVQRMNRRVTRTGENLVADMWITLGRVSEKVDSGRSINTLKSSSFIVQTPETNEYLLTLAYLLTGADESQLESLSEFTENFCESSQSFTRQCISEAREKYGHLPELFSDFEAVLVSRTGIELFDAMLDKIPGPLRLVIEAVPTAINSIYYCMLFGVPTPEKLFLGMAFMIAMNHNGAAAGDALSKVGEAVGYDPQMSRESASTVIQTVQSVAGRMSHGAPPLTAVLASALTKVADLSSSALTLAARNPHPNATPIHREVARSEAATLKETHPQKVRNQALFMILAFAMNYFLLPIILGLFSGQSEA